MKWFSQTKKKNNFFPPSHKTQRTAWNDLGNMSKEDARSGYIKGLEKLIGGDQWKQWSPSKL